MFFFFPCFLSPVFPRSAFFPASPSSLILVAMQCNGWMSVWQGHLLSCPRGSLQKHCQRHNGPEGSAIYLPGISITHFTSRTLLLKYSNFQQIYKKNSANFIKKHPCMHSIIVVVTNWWVSKYSLGQTFLEKVHQVRYGRFTALKWSTCLHLRYLFQIFQYFGWYNIAFGKVTVLASKIIEMNKMCTLL